MDDKCSNSNNSGSNYYYYENNNDDDYERVWKSSMVARLTQKIYRKQEGWKVSQKLRYSFRRRLGVGRNSTTGRSIAYSESWILRGFEAFRDTLKGT